MAHTIAELQKMSRAQLIAEHDKLAGHTEVGTKYYLEQLRHKDSQRLTLAITWMTAVMAVATIVNVVLVAIGR